MSHRVAKRTGVKCLPHNKLPTHGDVLHDCHAEVLARRGFLLWLATELAKGQDSAWLCYDSLVSQCDVHLYISTLPCPFLSSLGLFHCSSSCVGGAASMSLLRDTQDPALARNNAPESRALSIPAMQPLDAILGQEAATRVTRGRLGYDDALSLRTKPGEQ